MRSATRVFAARTTIVPRARSTSPPKRERLTDPQACEHERCEQRPPLIATHPRATVEHACAESRAAMCSARSSHERRGCTAGSLRLRPRAGLRPISSYSAATSRIAWTN